MRKPEYTQQRKFTRGEVFFVNLPAEPQVEPDPSRVMNGPHRCVVLFDSAFPRKTVTILPISSLYKENGEQKKTIATDLTLKASDYEQAGSTYKNTITKDSFIRTEQIRSVSRHLLENKVGELRPDDMMKLDIYLIASLQLQNTVNMLIEAEIERRGMPAQNRPRQSGMER
ncbi:type II toxin-antitoxin system PemK/MazF family toxin [Brevibacillus porteri]|uniref:type II toxin-antitoxin system PemK/MazF family toxin n=1 Tax=Brevibacillus porteri TaxID=2126350 RepID=UPI003D1FB4FC